MSPALAGRFLTTAPPGKSPCPSFLKGSFSRKNILGWKFYSLSILNISSHCFLAFKVSVDKTSDRLPCTWQFAFKILSLLFNNLIKMCLFGDFWASWIKMPISLFRFGSYQILFLYISFLPLSPFFFWNSHDVYLLSFDDFTCVIYFLHSF